MLRPTSVIPLLAIGVIGLVFYNWSLISTAWAPHKPLPNLAMVKVETGNYNLTILVPNSFGRKYHSKSVTIKQRFEISRYEVTIDQWNLCFKEGGCPRKARQRRHEKGNYPVTYVSWFDTKKFTEWLSKRTGRTYRLPTEEEWAYAAFTGKDVTKDLIEKMISARVDFSFTSGKKFRRTRKIGTFGENKWGIADTRGAVWNWTMTCWFSSDEENKRPWTIAQLNNRDLCANRVVQGDERGHVPVFVGEVLTGGCGTGAPIDHIGFRVVREIS